MRVEEFLSKFEEAKKRVHVIGDPVAVVIALDMEGRIFTVLNGEVVNKVNTDAITGQSTCTNYLNPGGDALWPAPEGTSLGYQYPTGNWRVSPAINSARYLVTESTDNSATVVAEIDLINNQGLGIPTIFKRNIVLQSDQNFIVLNVTESITYIGTNTLKKAECNLAPWSLCQFNCRSDSHVVFPCSDKSHVWDLYENKIHEKLVWENNHCRVSTEGADRFQIGIDQKVPFIEFFDPINNLRVKRESRNLSKSDSYIDISDVQPTIHPTSRGVRYSVYNDDNGFMEIEAAGGCPELIEAGTEMKVTIITTFEKV